MIRYPILLALVLGLALAGVLVATTSRAPEIRLASPTEIPDAVGSTPSDPADRSEPDDLTEGPRGATVVPGVAVRPDVRYEKVPGTPRPSPISRDEAASMLAHARLMMGLGTEEPVDSYGLHMAAQQETDPVARAVLEQATQEWCRGAFPIAYAALSRLADEPPPAEYEGMEEWERALRADPIDRVVARWRAGDFYAPPELREMEDREGWLDRRARFGVDAQAAHCEHQGSFEEWAAAQR